MRTSVVVCLTCLLLVTEWGCRHRVAVRSSPAPATVPEAPPPPPPLPSTDGGTTAPRAAETEEEAFARKTLEELNAERPLTPVYFAYDSARLDATALDTLHAHARWLTRWSSTRIVTEGHCDERGTAEYNLALGERRASAVRDYLVSLGITPERVTPVSKGKEAPACTQSFETCWRENRRGQFVFSAK